MRTMLVLPVTLHQILSALIKGNIRFTNQFTKIKAIETCIILLIDQVAADFYKQRSLVLAQLKDFFYWLTKTFHEFELVSCAAQWKLPFNQGPFFKTQIYFLCPQSIPVSIALEKIFRFYFTASCVFNHFVK